MYSIFFFDILFGYLINEINVLKVCYSKLIQQANDTTLLIFISHSGEDELLCKTLKEQQGKNMNSIAFVGNHESTIGQLATLTFSTHSYSPFSTDDAQPQNFFGLTLVIFEHLISDYLNYRRKNK